MAKRNRKTKQLPAARGRQELSWSFRARGRGPGLGGLLTLLVLAGLAGLVGLGDDPPATAPEPAGGVVEQGRFEGVDYQIRAARTGYQGWVVLDGQWSQLDEASGPDLDRVREEIRAFVTWLHSGDPNPSVNQLQGLLEDAGVRHFRAGELLRIRHPSIAAELGYQGPAFEAPVDVLANLVGVAKVADELRRLYAGPITVLNGYRPAAYNERVQGSPNSQHLTGRALDLTAANMPRLRDAARSLYADGLIRGLRLYTSNIHVDTRTGAPHFWESEELA